MQIAPLKTAVLLKNFDLLETIKKTLVKNRIKLKNGDIVVVSSKVVALSQGRVVDLESVKPSAAAKKMRATRYGTGKEDPRIIELVLREAQAVIPGRMLITLTNHVLIPEAGIDLSNSPKGVAILWPREPFEAARRLWKTLRAAYRVKELGVVISDSHCQPLRWGTTGVALAWAGFEGVEDARGQKDIYGTPLKITRKAVADNLAAASMIVMGEAGERCPLVHVAGAPVKFTRRVQSAKDFFVSPRDCIFGGIYGKAFVKKAQRVHEKSIPLAP